MNILHLSSYYIGSWLYKFLFEKLSDLDIKQEIFVPVREENLINVYNIENNPNVKVKYYHIHKPWFKFLYKYKINKYLRTLNSEFEIRNFTCIHAHTLFSDGGVAYKLKRKYHLPYIVTIRNSDLNDYLRLMPHLKYFARKILNNASKIIFLTPVYQSKTFIKIYGKSIPDDILNKVEIIPNGVQKFWFDNKNQKSISSSELLNFLYIGTFDKNKNLLAVINAFNSVQNQKKGTLTLIGSDKSEYSKDVINLAAKSKNVTVLEANYNQSEMLKYYQKSHIFIMPSFTESFGLVYVEALLNGLPIIYTKGEGFDGFFKNGQIGYCVNPKDINEIENSINNCIDNYNVLQSNIKNINFDKFDWDKIANIYSRIYFQFR